jgi:hypothetical protein
MYISKYGIFCTIATLSLFRLNTTSAPSKHLGLFWRKKTSTFTMEQNIAHVNFLRKPSKSLILMAVNALITICLIHLLPLAKF